MTDSTTMYFSCTWTDFAFIPNDIQIYGLALRSLLEIVSPKFEKYCPTPNTEGNISQTSGKQFPIVTDR